jgi:hypothetical protein
MHSCFLRKRNSYWEINPAVALLNEQHNNLNSEKSYNGGGFREKNNLL